MRSWERQEGETPKAWEAFKVYRDLGPSRTLRETAAVVYGNGTVSVRRIEEWSRKHDWVGRAQAHDDYHDLIRAEAVEEHERARARELAGRRAALEERRLALEERHLQLQAEALEKAFTMVRWPLEKAVTEEEREDEDGKRTVIYNIYPAKWSFNTLSRILEACDQSPTKIAPTDPIGRHQYGTSEATEEQEKRMVADLLRRLERREEEG